MVFLIVYLFEAVGKGGKKKERTKDEIRRALEFGNAA